MVHSIDKDFFDYLVPGFYSGHGVGDVLPVNPAFSDWEGSVVSNIFDRDVKVKVSRLMSEHPERFRSRRSAWRAINNYLLPEDASLLERVFEHSNDHSSPSLYSDVFFLVHSFFLQVGLMHYLDNGDPDLTRQRLVDAENYKKNTLRVLEQAKANGFSVVSMSTLHHYPVIDSYFIERGLIDRVIFSLFDYGLPANKSEQDKVRMFDGKNVYVGGCFNGYCPSMAVMNLKNRSSPVSVFWVGDLLLDKPVMGVNKQYSDDFRIVPTQDALSVHEVYGLKKKSLFYHILGKPFERVVVPDGEVVSLDSLL